MWKHTWPVDILQTHFYLAVCCVSILSNRICSWSSGNMWESNEGNSSLLHSPSDFQPVFTDSGIHLLNTANETIICLKFILQHRYSFLCFLTMAINKIMIIFWYIMPTLSHMIIEKMELNMALGSAVDLSYQSMDWQQGWTKYRMMGQNWEESEKGFTLENWGSRKIEIQEAKHSIKICWKECNSLETDRSCFDFFFCCFIICVILGN